MAVSDVEICNLALANVRAGEIASLTEKSHPARVCKLKYPVVLEMLLEENSFKFSRTIAPLQKLANVDVFNWAYSYAYPSNCVLIERLILPYEQNTVDDATGVIYAARKLDDLYDQDQNRHYPFDVVNVDDDLVVVCNMDNMYVKYRRRVTTTQLFSPSFVEAFSWLLAAHIAIPILGGEVGRALRKDAIDMYSQLIKVAVANDKLQTYTEPVDSDFISIRR